MSPLRLAFGFCLSLLILPAWAQIPIGSWRMHSGYQNAIGLARINEKIYTATRSGLFVFDPVSESTEVLNKVNGLSDIEITAMGKHPDQNVLMLGYQNGNLDLIMDGRIFNLRDIVSSSVLGSRRINKIKFSGSFAYIAADFGMVVYNYRKREIRESNLLLGIGNKTVKVFDCARYKDSVYALTIDGLMSIGVREDFQNTNRWRRIGTEFGLPAVTNIFQTIDSVNGDLIITTLAGLHPYRNFAFHRRLVIGGEIRSVRAFNNQLLVCGQNNVLEVSKEADELLKTLDQKFFRKLSRPSDVLYDPDGTRWVSDLDNGLLKITPTDTIQILPNGPGFSGSFSVSSYKDEIVLHAGGYTFPGANASNNNAGGFAIFRDNTWTTYRPDRTPGMPKVRDFVTSIFNPADQSLYFTTHGYGMVQKKGDNYIWLNDSTTGGGLCNVLVPDCIFSPAVPSESSYYPEYVKLGGAAFDRRGNLWVANFEAPSGSVRKRSPDGTWEARRLPFANGKYALDVLVDRNNFKWIRMAPGRETGNAGIWLINSDESEQVPFTTQSGQGSLPSNDVYDVEEDKSGYIWVGTSKGLAVFYNPVNAFFQGGTTVSTPIFPPEAGRPVLENDVVTSIEIDGADRKWVGTRDNGVFVFNSDITQVVHQFNTENSPLLSNTIYDIAINRPTGEVFFATDAGLVSYQSDASENVAADGTLNGGSCDEKSVELFPNPVTKEYEGTIAVRGLANDSEVRFITASGKLVYETRAKGGTATWNGFTYDGKKAAPGIYLVLSTTSDGKANCVSKLAILD
jgi:hypothetical protein